MPTSCFIVKNGSVKIRSRFPTKSNLTDDEASKLRTKTEKTFPKKQAEISILGPGAIIGDKEVVYKKQSNFDAVVNMDNSVFYEIKGDAFSNLIKYNQTFFKNFMKKTNARE